MRKWGKFLIIFVICLALFLVPIAQQEFVYADSIKKVYLGGQPLGVIAYADGIVVTELVEIISDDKIVCPAKDAGVFIGDIIKFINGKKIQHIYQIRKIIEEDFVQGQPLKVQVLRNKKLLNLEILPCKDKSLQEYKLGVLVKNDIAGVGTMTFVNPENMRFGGLGHRIYDNHLPNRDIYSTGKIFECSIVDIVKAKNGKVGELRGHFNRTESIGKIDKNNEFGIYGQINGKLTESAKLVEVGSRDSVRMGKAYIYSSIEGNKPKKYQVEIIKNVRQHIAGQKGMIVRIVDKQLLKLTGGIVQGMSGSPIIQDDKLIGAITHVFINDSTKGYGVYIDWMISN